MFCRMTPNAFVSRAILAESAAAAASADTAVDTLLVLGAEESLLA